MFMMIRGWIVKKNDGTNQRIYTTIFLLCQLGSYRTSTGQMRLFVFPNQNLGWGDGFTYYLVEIAQPLKPLYLMSYYAILYATCLNIRYIIQDQIYLILYTKTTKLGVISKK